ncbi:MAG: Tad domain-containing protein, partial [Gemmatimonadota bacterium]
MALVAVSLVPLMALLALGIDMGMLFDAHREAQRAADSAALAGASAFLDFPALEAPKPARERAVEYAVRNWIRNKQIEASEVTVAVNVDSATVTVGIRRDGVSTWFARLLGETEVPIGAQATAQASDAGTAQCLKPFAVPDMWDESNDDTNHNRVWDDNEKWNFDPGQDRYERYDGDVGSGSETGYGSDWRNFFSDANGNRFQRDYGRRIKIKVTDPKDSFVPSFFYPWVVPPDANQPDCGEDRAGNDAVGNGKGNGNGGTNNGNGGTNNGNGGTNNGNGGTNNGNGGTNNGKG